MGNRLIYTDTYEQAVSELARLGSQQPPTVAAASPPAGQPLPAVEATPSSAPDAERRLGTVRDHLRRYRELSSQGRWAEAGKELEAIEALVGKR
jgi:hypothetical protein